jgi:uncharacterized protein
MKILIDINHPAHVHLFRNAAKQWIEQGRQVIVAARMRDMIPSLLTAYGIAYEYASTPRPGRLGLAVELIEHDWNILKLTRKHRADVLIGTSPSIGHVSKATRARSILFDEDDPDYQKDFVWLAYPFADTIVVPAGVRGKRTAKYVEHDSYHELAYLHPNHFKPDPSVLKLLGVQEDEPFFILRMVAFKAHHDYGHSGLSYQVKRQLIQLLSQHGKVFITAEGDLPAEFQPFQINIPAHQIHNALGFARMLICDSQTMTIEAAVLGTPAIRCNTFVGRCSVIEELQNRYGLTYGFLPTEEDQMLQFITDCLHDNNLRQTWQARRQRMLEEKIDFAAWMVEFVNQFEQ